MVRCVGDSATTRWVLRMCISMPVRLTKNLAVNSLSRDVRRDALLLSCAHGSANDPRGDTTPDMGTLTWHRHAHHISDHHRTAGNRETMTRHGRQAGHVWMRVGGWRGVGWGQAATTGAVTKPAGAGGFA